MKHVKYAIMGQANGEYLTNNMITSKHDYDAVLFDSPVSARIYAESRPKAISRMGRPLKIVQFVLRYVPHTECVDL